MRLSNSARKDFASGEIVNFIAADIQRHMETTIYLPTFLSAPIQILVAMYFIWQELGNVQYTLFFTDILMTLLIESNYRLIIFI